MTYSMAALLGVLIALAVDLAVLRTRLVLGRVFWLSYLITVGFQLLANGILAGRGVVRYDPAAILGPRLAGAPVEDLAFGFALVLSTLVVWSWLGSRGLQRPVRGGPGQLREHLGGVVGQLHGGQGAQGDVGEFGDALLGPGQRPRADDDLP